MKKIRQHSIFAYLKSTGPENTTFKLDGKWPNSLEKWLILGLRQERPKINLEHLIVPKSNKVFKIKQNPQ